MHGQCKVKSRLGPGACQDENKGFTFFSIKTHRLMTTTSTSANMLDRLLSIWKFFQRRASIPAIPATDWHVPGVLKVLMKEQKLQIRLLDALINSTTTDTGQSLLTSYKVPP